MKKKLVGALMCVAMTATVLAGCGNSSEPAAAPAETTPAIPADDVPKTSLMREFIGGGCYQV